MCSAGGTIVVPATDFAENYRLNLTGTPAANFTLEVPATKRRFFCQNQSGRIATLEVSGGATPSLTVSAGAAVPVFGDGVGFHGGNKPDLLSFPLAAVDGANDSFLFWDASAGGLARVLGDDLPSGRNALVARGSNLSVADASDQIVPWDTEIQDDFDLHDQVTNNTRLTVPRGATLVKLNANIEWAAAAAGHRDIRLLKNGLNFAGEASVRNVAISASLGLFQNVASPVLVATSGDYFELQVRQESGAALNLVAGDHSWFSMEIVA